MAMNIESGKAYVTRNGNHIVDVQATTSVSLPFMGVSRATKETWYYTIDGIWGAGSGEIWDLVSEHIDQYEIDEKSGDVQPLTSWQLQVIEQNRVDSTINQLEDLYPREPLTGVKHDQTKVPYHLLSVCATEEMLKVLAFGADKYSENNWRGGFKWSRLLSAAARHLFAYMKGEDRDPETGCLHTAHLMCCAMFLTEHHLRKLGTDDRYKETT